MSTFDSLWNSLVNMYSWLPPVLQVAVLLIASLFVVGIVLKILALVMEILPFV